MSYTVEQANLFESMHGVVRQEKTIQEDCEHYLEVLNGLAISAKYGPNAKDLLFKVTPTKIIAITASGAEVGIALAGAPLVAIAVAAFKFAGLALELYQSVKVFTKRKIEEAISRIKGVLADIERHRPALLRIVDARNEYKYLQWNAQAPPDGGRWEKQAAQIKRDVDEADKVLTPIFKRIEAANLGRA